MKKLDYTKDVQFWNRLQSFVEDVQTGCAIGEEEKSMILNICKLKKDNIKNENNIIIDLEQIKKLAEQKADSQERRGCGAWHGLYQGFIYGYQERMRFSKKCKQS